MTALQTASDIAARAAELVGGDRAKTHGDKKENFTKIAAIWNAYLDIRKPGPLTALDVGHLMVGLKLARTQLGAFNIDDYIDGAGYFACSGEIASLPETLVDMVGTAEVEGRFPRGTLRALGATAPAKTFKVGDRVRAVYALANVSQSVGKSATVVRLQGTDFLVRFDEPMSNDQGYTPTDGLWYAGSGVLELVPDDRPLQVGDDARYKYTNLSNSHVLHIQRVDVAADIAHGNCSCGAQNVSANLSDLERVT